MSRSLFHAGRLILIAFLIGTPFYLHAADLRSSNFIVRDPVVGGGFRFGTSTSFQLFSGSEFYQTGTSTATSFTSRLGFLYFPFATAVSALSATGGDAQVSLSWTASTAGLGFTVSSYQVGQSTSSGGPYTFTNVGNVTNSTRTSLTNGTAYYFIVRTVDGVGGVIATSTQVSATPVSAGGGSGGGGGGGGGGGAGGGATPETPPAPTGGAVVILTGRSYPGSTVTILRDGVLASRVPVGETALFTTTISGISAGLHLFSVYAEDTNGNQSSITPIPATLANNVTTTISGIFIAPTIDVDKAQVKKGSPIRVFGQSTPSSDIVITVNSETELFFQTSTDKDGVYSFSFLTSPLELGNHSTKSTASLRGEVSRTSRPVAFVVGNEDKLKAKPEKKCGPRGDLNCDGRVNLVDFSIQAYWYKKKGFPVAYDLNSDSSITLIDFSIMASNWTG